jgi:hypothetical protein
MAARVGRHVGAAREEIMIRKFIAPLVAMVLALSLTQFTRAEDATATGTVQVTVTDKDGKAVEGATVRITAPRQAAPKTDQKLADEQKPADNKRPTPVAEGKTDKDGKVTLEKVPAGNYNLSANLRSVGSAREKIEVKAGETKTVELKLAPRNAGGAK